MMKHRTSLLVVVLCGTILIGASSAAAGDAPLSAATPSLAASTLQVWATPENLANTATDSRVPSLVVTGGGTVHAVWEEEESIYHTSGSSGSWPAPAQAVLGDSPSLTLDSSNVVHMAFVSEIGGSFDVFYARWDGGGWTLPVNVSATSGVSSAPVIAFAPGDSLHIVWADNTGGTMALYHGQSSDGSSWSTFPIPNGTGSTPALAVSSNGILHLAWQSADTDTGLDEIWHTQLSGGSWSLPENISASPDEASTAPSLAVDPITHMAGHTVHIVWQEALGPNTAIYYSSGQSGAWIQAGDASGTLQSAKFPALGINSAGIGFLLWDEGSVIMGRGLYAATSTWAAREEVASDVFGISDPALFVSSSTVHAAWAEEVSAFNWDIFYSTRPACVLPADMDRDGDVDIVDIMEVAGRWRTSCEYPDPDSNPATPNYEAHYDLNGDCNIDIVDIMVVAVDWGESCN